MSKFDLSLDGILDSRWILKDIGNGKFKLEYSSLKGIPSIEETQIAIKNVLDAKKIDSIYISGVNGDIEVTASQIIEGMFSKSSKKEDLLSKPFGAEEDLLLKEDRGII